MSRFTKDIKKFGKYVVYSAKSGLKSEVAGSHLGWVWWILEPILFMLVYWFIYTIIFGSSAQYFPIYVFIGLSIWNFFNKSFMESIQIVNANKAVVSKVYVPKYMLIIISMLKQSFKLVISMVIVVIMMIIYRVQISFYILWIIPVMLTLFLVTFGLNCIVAHFGVFVEDLKTACAVALRVVFYMSGVFYEIVPRNGKVSRLPETLAIIMSKCNPFAFLMTSARNCLIYASNVGYKVLAAWFVVGVVLSIIGIRLIYKYENSYVKVM